MEIARKRVAARLNSGSRQAKKAAFRGLFLLLVDLAQLSLV